MKNIEEYERVLAAKGVSLEGLGLREVALRADDALTAIRALRNSSVPILGGDVYLEQLGSVTVGYANWYIDRQDGETLNDFARRSYLKAEDYVASFPRRAEEQPLFVLVLSTD